MMNLNKLAKLCGVSVATVSKAFSDSKEISEKTKEKIFDTAKKHGVYDRYSKNPFSKKIIAVICPELNSDYYNNFVTLLEKFLYEKGGIMTVGVSKFDTSCTKELFTYYSEYCKVDGIIVLDKAGTLDNTLNIPAISVFSNNASQNIENISTDFFVGTNDAVKHLKDSGHTNIGFVGEPLTKTKLDTFRNCLRNNALNVNEDYIKISDKRFEDAGVDVIEKWINSKKRLPTAIIAAYDYIAIGVIKALKNNGISVPDDISVIGMDNIPISPYLETSLSTIGVNTEALCRIASELIMKKVENHYYFSEKPICVPTVFFKRNSTGKVNPLCKQFPEE